jgi:hypothetical protein
MRDLFAPAPPEPAAEPVAAGGPPAAVEPALVQAGVQFLEALAVALTGPGARVTTDPKTGQPALIVPLPPAPLVQRGAQALRAILQALDGAAKTPPP